MILGFTGPRNGPTAIQSLWLTGVFSRPGVISSSTVSRPDEFHHGACIGSDAAAHWLAIDAEIPLIVVHPPIITKYMMDLEIPLIMVHPPIGNQVEYDVGNTHIIILRAHPYHDRDRDIVDVADRVISTPAGEPTPHSGTWFTLNYALSQHKPINLCYPDGEEDTL